MDHITGAIITRIPARSHYHAERSTFIPLGRFLVQLAFTGRQAKLNQIGLHAQHNRLGFWIAKAAVKFDNLRIALFVDHQARVEKTGVGVAFCRHAFHGWPDDSFHRALMNLIGHYWRRGVSAHPAGVWPGIFIAYAFVILAGGHRQHMLTVHHHDKARFFAVEELFDNDAMPRVAKSVACQHIVNSRFRFFLRHRHDNAFPGSQTVSFNDDWRAFLTQIRQRRFYLGEVLVFRRRDLMAGQEILGKRFRAFQLRGTCGWAEDFQPGGTEGIHHAFHQRRFRADDG
ncbi:hypothetical protein ExPCM20_01362 [Escherichia coli]|nr:hypothetical protein ExPCM20_01362 [Escherichia coli]